MGEIPILIPSYEPDERLVELLRAFRERGMGPLVLVDDGSGEAYRAVFAECEALMEGEGSAGISLLTHPQNRGKGAALKTGFSYVLQEFPDAVGVVTADSDGQHTPECIARIGDALAAHPQELVMGCRTFDGDDVPWKSRMGNKITSVVFRALSGMALSDTQTGLRGIPSGLMRACLDLPGDRFEFEMQMLLATKGTYPLYEVPIQTVYDSKDNHQTHFDAVHDSIRIYRALVSQPVLFTLSSFASSLVDVGLFALLCAVLKNVPGYVPVSVVAARLVSASLNYWMNSRIVFASKQEDTRSVPRYVVLALVIMGLSTLLTTAGTTLLPAVPEVLVKIVVDVCLFVANYFVQKKLVF